MVIERQLGGELTARSAPEGLDARLTVPLTHERWPGRSARAGAATPFGQDNLK